MEITHTVKAYYVNPQIENIAKYQDFDALR
jgi:hypothetical protein